MHTEKKKVDIIRMDVVFLKWSSITKKDEITKMKINDDNNRPREREKKEEKFWVGLAIGSENSFVQRYD